MSTVSGVVDYFFPLSAEEPKGRVASHSWLSRKLAWLYQFQQDTGLVRQTFIVLCNVVRLADKLFSQIPRALGRVALLSLNALGVMYIDEITADLFKIAMDTCTSLLRKDIG